MAVTKSIRHRPAIDMTPMVDLGFLLVTFFMMTTQFAPTDLVSVAIPHSTSETKLPESNIATVLISKEGNVYFRMDGTKSLKTLGSKLNEAYNLGLTDGEVDKFSTLSGFGMSLAGIKEFLKLSEAEQKSRTQPGIPVETGKNELSDWLMYARIANPKASFVVKADKATPYPAIKKVMNTLQDRNINRFSLITDTETTTGETTL
jgi:biopolymer transport protein ExbD